MPKDARILLAEDRIRNRIQVGEDIPGRGCVLSTHQSRAELSIRHEHIQIVATDKLLRHADDRVTEGHLAVVIGRIL